MKHLLVCLAGMTPQVITETLYALIVERGEMVDEVRVINTIAGKKKVMNQLLDPEHGKFYEFCKDYSIDPEAINFSEKSILLLTSHDNMTMDDIRTVEDNQAAADIICSYIKKLASDSNTRIHASVAGGRKTMGIYLTAAMQLFGRVCDRLSHVLVSEDFEQHSDFYYPPREPRKLEVRDRSGALIKTISTADARVYLAEIPFIRMRSILTKWLSNMPKESYNDFVKRAQDDLDMFESSPELNINFKKKTVSIAGRTAVLTEREFFIYSLLAILRKQGGSENSFLRVENIDSRIVEQLLISITKARGDEINLANLTNARYRFVKDIVRDLQSSDENNRESLYETFSQVLAKIKKKFQNAGIPESCYPSNYGMRGTRRYGIDFPPDRIQIG